MSAALLDKQHTGKESDAQYGVFQKVLFVDIARQARLPGAIVSADAAHCYDRIAHPFASLVFQILAVRLAYVVAMLSYIQHMAFGDSTIFMAAAACQGNTASPAVWSTISSVLVSVYKQRGHGMRHVTPITQRPFNSDGMLFVDDTDLLSLNRFLSSSALWAEVQASTTFWSMLLKTSRGSLKGIKCFGYLFNFGCSNDGSWYYAQAEGVDLRITLRNGTIESIALLDPLEAQVTLRVATCPTGDFSHHLTVDASPGEKWHSVKARPEKWSSQMKNSHLPPKHCWVSYKQQLQASMWYGLGCVPTPH